MVINRHDIEIAQQWGYNTFKKKQQKNRSHIVTTRKHMLTFMKNSQSPLRMRGDHFLGQQSFVLNAKTDWRWF